MITLRVVKHNIRDKFIDIVVMAFMAVLCVCDNWVEISRVCKVKISLFNETAAIKQILKLLDISRCTVTIDAIGCQIDWNYRKLL